MYVRLQNARSMLERKVYGAQYAVRLEFKARHSAQFIRNAAGDEFGPESLVFGRSGQRHATLLPSQIEPKITRLFIDLPSHNELAGWAGESTVLD